MYYHKRSTRKRYRKRLAADPACSFCQNIADDKILLETEHVVIVENRTPYDIWEHHTVVAHYMVIPKRHVHSLHDLTDEELFDAMKLCAQYEADGFNVYARSTGSPRRSVYHQHTHLIKIGPKVAHGGVYLQKPYLHVQF